jgi:hypothetical protein
LKKLDDSGKINMAGENIRENIKTPASEIRDITVT